MKVYYAVPWIEVEYGWGSRPEGFKVFDNLDECINSTKKSSEEGNYDNGDGYFGPERPLFYYEIADEIEVTEFPIWIDNIKFKSNAKYIENEKK